MITFRAVFHHSVQAQSKDREGGRRCGSRSRAVPSLRSGQALSEAEGLAEASEIPRRPTLHQAEPEEPLELFGTGEAHAIALARERSWVLLINDTRPLQLAQSLGIDCVAVPDFCVLLYSQGKITYPAVRGYLRRLVPTTSPTLIQQAEQIVDEIADRRGELT